MTDNPYTVKEKELENFISKRSAEMEELRKKIAWYQSFDKAAVTKQVDENTDKEKKLSSRIEKLNSEIAKIDETLSQSAQVTTEKRKAKRWGFITFPASNKKIEKPDPRRETFISEKNSKSQERDELNKLLFSQSELLRRYSSFYLRNVGAELAEGTREIGNKYVELSEVIKRKTALDAELDPLVKKLTKISKEIEHLQDCVNKAERLITKLNQAPSGYERKKIHEESERKLQNRSPAQFSYTAKKEIANKKRTVKKLKQRIEEILHWEAQEIRSLIIDGSNLCYEGSQFIGLDALRELCKTLQKEYDVFVFFDGSILEKMCLRSEDDLKAQLSGIKISIVTDSKSADETILNAASHDSTTFVISADRFADYPDKLAVSEGRIIRPRIADKRVILSHLKIS